MKMWYVKEGDRGMFLREDVYKEQFDLSREGCGKGTEIFGEEEARARKNECKNELIVHQNPN